MTYSLEEIEKSFTKLNVERIVDDTDWNGIFYSNGNIIYINGEKIYITVDEQKELREAYKKAINLTEFQKNLLEKWMKNKALKIYPFI